MPKSKQNATRPDCVRFCEDIYYTIFTYKQEVITVHGIAYVPFGTPGVTFCSGIRVLPIFVPSVALSTDFEFCHCDSCRVRFFFFYREWKD